MERQSRPHHSNSRTSPSSRNPPSSFSSASAPSPCWAALGDGENNRCPNVFQRNLFFRQACMNSFKRYGIVGCRFTNWWRTADEFSDDMQLSSSTGEASAAVCALATDASAALADRRFVMVRLRESGGPLWFLPHYPGTADQLLCPQEMGRRGVQAGSAFASCLSGPSRRSLALWPTELQTAPGRLLSPKLRTLRCLRIRWDSYRPG